MSNSFPYRVFCCDDASDQPMVVFDVMATDIAAAVSEARKKIETRAWGRPDRPESIQVLATVSPILGAEFVAHRAPSIDFVVTVRNQHARAVGS
jgi:hypothetical protein